MWSAGKEEVFIVKKQGRRSEGGKKGKRSVNPEAVEFGTERTGKKCLGVWGLKLFFHVFDLLADQRE